MHIDTFTKHVIVNPMQLKRVENKLFWFVHRCNRTSNGKVRKQKLKGSENKARHVVKPRESQKRHKKPRFYARKSLAFSNFPNLRPKSFFVGILVPKTVSDKQSLSIISNVPTKNHFYKMHPNITDDQTSTIFVSLNSKMLTKKERKLFKSSNSFCRNFFKIK